MSPKTLSNKRANIDETAIANIYAFASIACVAEAQATGTLVKDPPKHSRKDLRNTKVWAPVMSKMLDLDPGGVFNLTTLTSAMLEYSGKIGNHLTNETKDAVKV